MALLDALKILGYQEGVVGPAGHLVERASDQVQVGLIAEDVAQVLPELAVYDRDGQPESVAYHLLPTLLLNELQKQHQQLQQARERIQIQDRKLKEIDSLRSEVAELRRLTTQLAAARTGEGLSNEGATQVAMAH